MIPGMEDLPFLQVNNNVVFSYVYEKFSHW